MASHNFNEEKKLYDRVEHFSADAGSGVTSWFATIPIRIVAVATRKYKKFGKWHQALASSAKTCRFLGSLVMKTSPSGVSQRVNYIFISSNVVKLLNPSLVAGQGERRYDLQSPGLSAMR